MLTEQAAAHSRSDAVPGRGEGMSRTELRVVYPDSVGCGEDREPVQSPRPAVGTTTARPRWSRLLSRTATGAGQEIIGTAAAVWISPVRWVGEGVLGIRGHRQPPRPWPVPDEAARPVVLVHGFVGSATSWFALRRALRADGRTVISFDYSPWASSVEELADRLVDTVQALLAVTGAGTVHLVGHSLGGVVIAQALTSDRLAGCVDLVVTLG